MTDPKEEEPTAEELAEAEALARVLDGAPSPTSRAPAGADAAFLIRHSRDGGELAQERADAVLARVEREARASRRRLRWIVPPVALAAAAAVALAVYLGRPPAGAPTATALPAPSADLVRAQLGAAASDDTAAAELAAAMRDYRRDVYAALEARYAGGDDR